MPHSLRAKIKGLRYKGIITDKDCDRLCKALDNEGVLEQIRGKIATAYNECSIEDYDYASGLKHAMNVIEGYALIGAFLLGVLVGFGVSKIIDKE